MAMIDNGALVEIVERIKRTDELNVHFAGIVSNFHEVAIYRVILLTFFNREAIPPSNNRCLQ